MKPLPIPLASVGRTDAPGSTAGNQSQRRQIRSDELFSGQREVLIEHAGEVYSLRQTSKGKLILTK
jgi:hemin uptake protein HemP